jgi:hypothetical protein
MLRYGDSEGSYGTVEALLDSSAVSWSLEDATTALSLSESTTEFHPASDGTVEVTDIEVT